MNKKILVLLPALAMLLASCGEPTPTPSEGDSSAVTSEVVVEGVNISDAKITLDIGKTADLVATVTPASVANRNIVWSSDNEAIATVNSNGRVTAVATGTANIKAASEANPEKFATCVVTVNKLMIESVVDTPELNKEYRLGLYQGHKDVNAMVYATGKTKNAGGQRLATSKNWDEGAIFKLVEGGAENTYKVQVVDGENIVYLSAPDDDYHWDENLATDPANALVWTWNAKHKTLITKHKKDGAEMDMYMGTNRNFTEISLTEGKYLGNDGNFTCHFYTRMEACDPTAVVVDKDTASAFRDGKVKLNAHLEPSNAVGDIVWSVEGNEKVTVDKDGLVSVAKDAVTGSTATVKATCGELSDSCVVTVGELLDYGTKEAPLTIAQAKVLIDKYEGRKTEHNLFVKGVVSSNEAFNTNYHNFSGWLASDDGMEAEGLQMFRAKYADEAMETTYKAENSLVGKEVVVEGAGEHYKKTGDKPVDKYEISVGTKVLSVADLATKPAATKIELDVAETLEMNITDTKDLHATVYPIGAAGDVVWTSSDPAVAKVEAGKVTALKAGKATITATLGELTDTVEITVKSELLKPNAETGVISTLEIACEKNKLEWPTDSGWEYITNNPDFPNAGSYKDAIKLNYKGQGVKTPLFVAQSKVALTLNISAINQNDKTDEAADADPCFEAVAYNLNGEEVTKAQLSRADATTGDHVLTLEGKGISYVTLIMVNYAKGSSKPNANVALHAVTIAVPKAA